MHFDLTIQPTYPNLRDLVINQNRRCQVFKLLALIFKFSMEIIITLILNTWPKSLNLEKNQEKG